LPVDGWKYASRLMTAARCFNEVYTTAAASETTIVAASLIYIPEREVYGSSCSVACQCKLLRELRGQIRLTTID
jgi:hypothetical protein